MLDADPPPEALGHHTGHLMNWVAMRSRAAFAAALTEVGLRPQQFAVLSVVAEREGLTQQQLVEATGVDASTMVQTLDALEAAGLAQRRPHETDRRKRAVHVTPSGRQMLAQAQLRAGHVGDDVFGRLTAGERRRLHALLRKLAGLR